MCEGGSGSCVDADTESDLGKGCGGMAIGGIGNGDGVNGSDEGVERLEESEDIFLSEHPDDEMA